MAGRRQRRHYGGRRVTSYRRRIRRGSRRTTRRVRRSGRRTTAPRIGFRL